MKVTHRAAIGLGLLFLLAPGAPALPQGGGGERIADAKPGDVRILASAAIRIPLDAVRAEASKAIGHPLVIEHGSARGNLKDAIVGGAGFEVAMLLPLIRDRSCPPNGPPEPRARSDMIAQDSWRVGSRRMFGSYRCTRTGSGAAGAPRRRPSVLRSSSISGQWIP